MPMSVVYTTFCGEIVHEVRNGVEHYYVPDTNGNTVQLLDAAGNKTDEWTYWPFGEVRTRTGTTATPFTFGGVLGYYTDTITGRMYVRARYLRADLARWQTVDPLWPRESPYGYVENAPPSKSDPTGLCGYIDSLECGLLCLGLSNYQANIYCWFPIPGKCYEIGQVLYCSCRCRGQLQNYS